jgi:hypothetical protein
MSSHEERCELLNAKMNLLKESKYNLTPIRWDVYYLDETYQAFSSEHFISSILTASALVEGILYWEHIRTEPKYKQAGTPLPQRTSMSKLFSKVRSFLKEPLKEIMDPDESFDMKPNILRFMQIRNKFAHGDLLQFIQTPALFFGTSDVAEKYGISLEEYMNSSNYKRGFENTAFMQITKSYNFVEKFNEYARDKYGKK